ncbi:hypothetical protein [uncultured Corynebacterium sp.]|uniref:hypothetical protein n=1 Tax=uncultured Corynebacterium sp. TaxID=159447 RepID=UPI0025DADD83|nr:hypothetical protein [uncultured Corynebacterium sp.]
MLLISYTWLASVLVPVALFVIASGMALDTTAGMMVLYMWVPSFILGNGMLAVFIARIPMHVFDLARCLRLWACVVFFHALFLVGAVLRVDHAIADAEAKTMFVAVVAAYALALAAAVRGIRAGETS